MFIPFLKLALNIGSPITSCNLSVTYPSNVTWPRGHVSNKKLQIVGGMVEWHDLEFWIGLFTIAGRVR